MYAIYGTWYHIHAHNVIEFYVRLVHSSIYTIYVISLSRAALIIILDILFVGSATSVIVVSNIIRYVRYARLPRILVCYLRHYN